MTVDEALAAVMTVIRADLPEAETRIEIGKILARFSQSRWSLGWDEGHAEAQDDEYWTYQS